MKSWRLLINKALSVAGIQLVRTNTLRSLMEPRAELRDVVTEIVKAAGADGVLTCYMNDVRLNIPAGFLTMFDHCLHSTHEKPLNYYVETGHLRWILANVREGDVVMDIGASGGVITAALAKAVGQSGKVIAFEPAKRAFALLESLICLNDLNNVVAEQIAICNQCGSVSFAEYEYSEKDQLPWRPEVSAIASSRTDHRMAITYDVKAITLDEYLKAHPQQSRIKMIKIDVEGFEVGVLKGGVQLIARDNPSFSIDIHAQIEGRGDTEAPCREILSSYGYNFHKLGHVLVAYL